MLFVLVLGACTNEPVSPDQWRIVSSAVDTVQDIEVVQGNLWAATQNAGLLESVSPYTNLQYLSRANSSLQSNNLTEVEFDGNTLLVGTREDGLFLISEAEMRVIDTANSPLRNNQINALEYFDGSVYIGTNAHYDIRVDAGGGLVDWEMGDTNLDDDNVSLILKTENALLVGTFEGGMKFNEFAYHQSNSPLSSNWIRAAVITASNELWASTYDKLHYISDTVWQEFDLTNSGLLSSAINDMVIDQKGNLCMATHHGFTLYDGQQWQSWVTELPHPIAECIFVDEFNNKWIGTFGGIAVFNEDGLRF